MAHRFLQYGGQLAVPTLVVGELLAGAHRHPRAELVLQGIEELLTEVAVLPVDEACARRFGKVRSEQLSAGAVTGVIDAMIAATALVHDLTLVTNNVKHFESIPGLRVENWLKP